MLVSAKEGHLSEKEHFKIPNVEHGAGESSLQFL